MSRKPGTAQKIVNEYAYAAGRDFFEEIPKAVWAAIAVSSITQGGDYIENARKLIAEEWDVLHTQGIVPQRPNAAARAAIAGAEGKTP